MVEKTVELEPNRPRGLYDRPGWAHLAKGQHREAVAALQRAVEYSNGDSLSLAGLGHAYAVTGNQTEARRILKELIARSRQAYVSPVLIALIHVGLGRKHDAVAWLEQGLQMHDSRMSWTNVEPRFDPLRTDPRFRALLRRMGFPE